MTYSFPDSSYDERGCSECNWLFSSQWDQGYAGIFFFIFLLIKSKYKLGEGVIIWL